MAAGYSDVTDFAPVRRAREPTPFDGILEQSRELIAARLDEAITAMLDKADEALLALVNDTRLFSERACYEQAREVAIKQRDVIETSFQERYLEDFQQRSNRARKIGALVDLANVSLDDLQLVEHEDLEETLKFNDMANKLRAYCEDELMALDQRVGVLLGDADLQSKDNPFSPQVICDAFKHACRQTDADSQSRRALLRLFDDHVLDDIRSVYKAVNALLVRNDILPKIRFTRGRGTDRQTEAPRTSAAATDQPPIADAASWNPQDIFQMLRTLVASSGAVIAQPSAAGAPSDSHGAALGIGPTIPAGFGFGVPQAGFGVPVILQGAELLGSLTRLQRGNTELPEGQTSVAVPSDPGTVNVLHHLRGTSIGAAMGEVDRLTLDIIAMLFDQLFDDPKVPEGIKGLIGRLQIPMLKVAIADKSFFSTKSHPARRLLDAMGEIAARLPSDFGASNPLFGQLQSTLQALVDGFNDDIAIFTEIREKLLELLAEEDRRIAEASRPEVQRAAQMETLALARGAAQQELKARLESHVLPAPVREFLAKHWVKLLILVHVKEGKDGQAWKTALEITDQLIWSVEPKATADERRQLGAVIPKLVRRLAVGMKSAGIDDTVRDGFFAKLMACHAQMIGASERSRIDAETCQVPASSNPSGDAVCAPTASPNLAPVEPPPEPLDFRAPITVKNPYGDGEVSVDGQDLDFTSITDGARAKREESIRRALDNLGIGTWVEFHDPNDPDARRTARLIFVSMHKTRYLFADRSGKGIITCSRAEIARRLRIGEVIKLDKPPEDSLFDRIMNSLLGKLRATGRVASFAS